MSHIGSVPGGAWAAETHDSLLILKVNVFLSNSVIPLPSLLKKTESSHMWTKIEREKDDKAKFFNSKSENLQRE